MVFVFCRPFSQMCKRYPHGYGEVVEDVLAWLVGKPLRLLN
jgi:hypothetical protein